MCRTKDGVINLVILIFNIINFAFIITVVTRSAFFAFLMASILGFVITGIFCVINLFANTETKTLHWPEAEVVYTRIWLLYYFIVTIFVLSMANHILQILAGIFGILTAIAYVVKSHHLYITHLAEEPNMVYVKQ
ncbi:hypothetical protein QE152_g6755 [Popillia japonica]|uniref:MARVEL domain-containing protein n=1 Tax=Popillia japonica TaxID=7064 RepID=A0AAW1MDI5_POPJA